MREDIISPYPGLMLVPTAAYAGRQGCRLRAAGCYEVKIVEDTYVVIQNDGGSPVQISRSDLHRANFGTPDP